MVLYIIIESMELSFDFDSGNGISSSSNLELHWGALFVA